MNDFHSGKELFYKEQRITPQVKAAIRSFAVVVITGARQVGKSTLLQNEFRDFKYVSPDDFSTLQMARCIKKSD